MSMDTQYGSPVDSGAVDPNSPPPDPMLQQEPTDLTAHDEPPNPYETGEATTRDRVEMCCLLAIETLAKACQSGQGASNMDYAVKAGQAAAAMGQAYQALATVELKEAQSQIQGLMDALGGQDQPADPSQGA